MKFIVIVIGNLATFGSCWGDLGHRTIGFLAEKYLSEAGLKYSQSLLGGQSLDDASLWADSYKKTPPGLYTMSWHFVDAMDDPPTSCNVVLARDCKPDRTCIIEAMKNMVSLFGLILVFEEADHQLQKTSELLNPTQSLDQRSEAYKMAIHLIGDVHMPLHAEGIAQGGNKIPTLHNGTSSNIHFFWDVTVLEWRTGSNWFNQTEAAKKYANDLYQQCPMTSRTDQVLLAYSPASAFDTITITDPGVFMLRWAQESNAWVCSYILADGPEAMVNRELAGNYYTHAIPILDLQVARAGQRLGMWINAMAEFSK
jgi:hypothetical protein